MKHLSVLIVSLLMGQLILAQLKWQNVDDRFGTLPNAIHVFTSKDSLGGKPSIAYYVNIDIKDKFICAKFCAGVAAILTPAFTDVIEIA